MLIFKIIKLKKNINSNIKIYFFDIFLPPINFLRKFLGSGFTTSQKVKQKKCDLVKTPVSPPAKYHDLSLAVRITSP